jgi:epoxyqueuosine reductase QueG
MRLALMSMPVMASIADSLWLSFTSLANNPVSPRGEFDEQFIGKLEGYAKVLGVGAIGYARIPQEFIFQEKAVLYKHAIVLVMEMDKNKINLAPSEETAFMVFQSYDALGLAVNELTQFLREHGYTAHAGHPLGGLVLYPALAEVAGLGWHGRHGLLITPEFGPRVRLAAIFTSVENLPVITENPHSWVEEFCYAGCGKCVRRCPPQAILEHPIRRGQSLLTHIDSNRCFPFFVKNHGCSICIKECTFNQKDYSKIRGSFLT